MKLTGLVSCCLWLLLAGCVQAWPAKESHLETLIDLKAQELVEARAPDGVQAQVPQMLEEMALELEQAVVGDDKRAKQLQSELAKLVDLPGLLEEPFSEPSDEAEPEGQFYQQLIDRLNSQPQGLLVALNGPQSRGRIVSGYRSLAEHQMKDLIGISSRHSQIMERARQRPSLGYFGKQETTQAEEKTLRLAKGIHRKLCWVKRLYVPLVFLKNMPIIGDQVERYMSLGGNIMKVVSGISYGLQMFIHLRQKEHHQAFSLGDSCEELPAEVVGNNSERERLGAALSDVTVEALKSSASSLLKRFDVKLKLVDGQYNELMYRSLGFILGELGKKMMRRALEG